MDHNRPTAVGTADPPARPPRAGGAVIPRGFAALTGVLAVGAAAGAGHLVAAVVSPPSSPYLAVGDAAVRLSPQPLTEWAKASFGTADKPVLLAGMAVVLALAGAAAGLAARGRAPLPGVAVIGALGGLGLAAVLSSPSFAPLDLLAPAVSTAVGVWLLRLLHARAVLAFDGPSHPEGRDGGLARRTVLIRSATVVGAGALAAGGLGALLGRGVGGSRQAVTDRIRAATVQLAPAVPAGAAFPELGTPTFVTPNERFYRIDVALRVPVQAAEDWRLRIHGMVDREIELTFEDLLARPLVERAITMTCVSNPVGGDLISTAVFTGVPLRELLLEAGVHPGADQIFSRGADGWYTGTPTDVVLEPGRGALLAIGMNGEALPPEHGFPVRMVVPGLYGYVSGTKWISELELTTFAAQQAYWLERGWSERGPIKTQARIDSPRGFATVPAGGLTVAGTAWAQHTGIGAVEVRLDGGPWRQAQLATEVGVDTWRMWKAEFDVTRGSHTVQVRATDRDGLTQTEQAADVVPDGATGWQATIFTVR